MFSHVLCFLSFLPNGDFEELAKKLRQSDAKLAVSVFEKRVGKADEEHQREVTDAKKKLLGDLEDAQTRATSENELDEAVLIRDLRRAVEMETDFTPSGSIKVISAVYGVNGNFIDVTDKVRRQIGSKDKWVYKVSIKDYGDPQPGAKEMRLLIIRYRYANKIRLKTRWEDGEIVLP